MDAAPDRAGQFSVSTEQADGRTTLRLGGELDIATADQLQSALDQIDVATGGEFVIDLSGISFMDSTGLRLLIEAHRAATEDGYELVIVTGESPAKRVLELTRMDEHLRVVPAL